MSNSELPDNLSGSEIAIIGMAGRFPGARNINEFWKNLRDGIESVTFLTEEELEPSGIDPVALSDPNFVKAAAILDEADMFDASFFGYSPREAEVMDPQHRVFLECAWEALEHAGYDPETYKGAIGVYAGAATNTYLYNLVSNQDIMAALGSFEVGIGNDLAFLSSRVSYKLNLTGPSYSVHTACSTSLVAVHLACQSLLIDECQIALAGGIAIHFPQKAGYLHKQGSVASPDGHTRAFDARAQGALFGNGVGIVVLKSLEDALADGDSIHAVIKGSAINNDGAFKASFSAPSVYGQADVISEALANAGVDASTISYIEAHGTGTALGDPIEIRALSKAFGSYTSAKDFCAIGSVKTNVGHLDTAAGVTALIKTVLALKHKMIPPSLHFQQPNLKIDFQNSPFFVNSQLSEWNTSDTPRRAGVSAFGIGGTNAHVILEEAPKQSATSGSRPWQLLVLSAKSAASLEEATTKLKEYLEEGTEAELADIAYTLKVGRKEMSHRRVIVCEGKADAITAMESMDAQRVYTGKQQASDRPVVFMFPGGGAQYVNMGLDLYQHEPVFRDNVDLCSDLLMPQLGFDLRDYLFPSEDRVNEAAERLKQTFTALPALFVIEYSLAKLWMHWGVLPKALIGHSLGEYVAACLAGVFSLQDALTLVVARGRLFEQLPRGAMLSVGASEADVTRLMSEELSIAAINASTQCVVSGPADAITFFSDVLAGQDIDCTRIHIEVAAHSQMVEPILGAFRQIVEKMQLNEPNIPFISNISGSWITAVEATDPHYWEAHLRSTVRFSQGVDELNSDPSIILLEVGPGHSLCSLAKMSKEASETAVILSSSRHALEKQTDLEHIVTAVGKLWASGVSIDWGKYYEREKRKREAVPTYAFQRQRYWVEAGRMEARGRGEARGKRKEIGEWFYTSGWRMKQEEGERKQEKENAKKVWMVMEEGGELSREVVERLRGGGEEVIEVSRGEGMKGEGENKYTIGGGSREGYEEVLRKLEEEGRRPTDIIHLWSITDGDNAESGIDYFKRAQQSGCYSILFLAQALAENDSQEPINLWVVTNGLVEVESTDKTIAEKATMLGPCKVIPQEMPHINIRCLDLPAPDRLDKQVIDQLMKEVHGDSSEVMIALRGRKRWVQSYEEVRIASEGEQKRELVEGGVYLITGGLGGVGQIIGEYLAREVRARLILVGRRGVGEREEWERRIMQGGEKDEEVRKIKAIKRMEEEGAEVVVEEADVADYEQMRGVVERIYKRYGQLNGVFHTAGVTGGPSLLRMAKEMGAEEFEMQFQPKAYGLYALEKALEGKDLDFFLLFSSNASVLGGLGFVTYSAANNFMDAFALNRTRSGPVPWISASWDSWPEETRKITGVQTSMDQYTMTREESVEAFRRVACMADEGHIVVATGDLPARFDLWIKRGFLRGAGASSNGSSSSEPHPRPDLHSTYIAPRNETEQKSAEIWQAALGIQQVGIYDNFFDLGGHSLLATRVTAQMRDAFQVDLQLRKLFESPTIAGLSQAIADLKAEHEQAEEAEMIELIAQLSEEDVANEIDRKVKSMEARGEE